MEQGVAEVLEGVFEFLDGAKPMPEPTEIPMPQDPSPEGSQNQEPTAPSGRGRMIAATIAIVVLLLTGAALEAVGVVVGFFEISWTRKAWATSIFIGPGWALVTAALAVTFRRHDRVAREDHGAVTWPVVIASVLLLAPLVLATGGMCGLHLMTIITHPTDVTSYFPHVWFELGAWGVILGAQLVSAAMTGKLAQKLIRSHPESP